MERQFYWDNENIVKPTGGSADGDLDPGSDSGSDSSSDSDSDYDSASDSDSESGSESDSDSDSESDSDSIGVTPHHDNHTPNSQQSVRNHGEQAHHNQNHRQNLPDTGDSNDIAHNGTLFGGLLALLGLLFLYRNRRKNKND